MSDTELISGESPLPEPAPAASQPVASPPPVGAEPIEKTDKKLSLKEQLHASVKEVREREEKQKSPAKQAAVAERERDPKGRLLPKSSDTASATAETQSPKIEKDAQPAQASTPAGPPPGWSAESKALYATLPDPLKADILKREKEVSDGFKKYSDDAKRYQEIDQVLSPARASYQQHGLNDAQAVNRLMEWERVIRSNPQAGIVSLARQYGIDLASLAQGSPGQSNGQDALAQYIQPIAQQVSSVQSELSRMQNERAASDIAQFSKDKPYFERVKVPMGKLMASGHAADLESAYQQATWADPTIREEMVQKQISEKLASHQQEATAKSQQARKAAVSPSTRAPVAPVLNGKEKTKGVRGSIMAAVEEIRESQRA